MSENTIHNEFPELIGKKSNYYEHRKTALRWIQKLSGKTWTDYNAHDPGITILEVLCYVLTEIEYKLDFPIEDLLSSSNDTNPFELKNNAFYLAEDILTSAPVTKEDYRKLIINGVPQINNAWLNFNKANKKIEVLLLKKKEVEVPEAINATRSLLEKNRAIGAQNMDIKVASFVYVSLNVHIHLDSNADPEDVLAHIFYNLNEKFLNVSPVRQTFSELENQDLDYSTIFDGPKMENGIITSNHLFELFETIRCVEIKKIMASISGVKMIDNLAISEKYVPNKDPDDKERKKYYENKEEYLKQEFKVDPGFVPFFSPMSWAISNDLAIYKNGKPVEFNTEKVHEIILYLFRKTTREYSLKTYNQATYSLQGKERKVDDYHSIKYDFPNAYGLNESGFSFIQNMDAYGSKQLKDYLLPYEQIIANTFKGLSNLWTMFSTAPIDGEFFHHPLKWEKDPVNVKRLNAHIGTTAPSEFSIKKVESNKLHYFLQRDKILTHLLARFDVHLHDEFEVLIAQDEVEYYEHAIHRKEKLLQNIDVLISNRSIFNNDSYQGLTSLERELYLYLGICNIPEELGQHEQHETQERHDINETHEHNYPVKPFYKVASELVDIIKKAEDENEIKGDRLSDAPQEDFEFKRYLKEDEEKRSKMISELLKLGVDRTCYKLIPSKSGKKNHIILKNSDESFILSIGKKKTSEDALEDISLFVKKFTEISSKAEGFYIVDHALLDLEEEDHEFTHFRLSFIFPKWTARFQNNSYQKEVERIVIKLIPAHVRGECFWLDLEEMTGFETVYYDFCHPNTDDAQAHETESKTKLKKIINGLSSKPK